MYLTMYNRLRPGCSIRFFFVQDFILVKGFPFSRSTPRSCVARP
jgi:hypothetical protein